MSDTNRTLIITKEQCSNAGKARAAALTPERRSEIAKKANLAKKCNQGIPKATHYGKLNIGGIEISCAVLEGGRAVVTESSIFKLFGIQRSGRITKQGVKIPRFLSHKCLQNYVTEDLKGGQNLCYYFTLGA